MATAIRRGGIETEVAGPTRHSRGYDLLQYASSRLFYAVLGIAGLLLWVLMQLPLGTRVRSTLLAVMAACFGMFALGWRLLKEQAAGQPRASRR